MIVVLDLDPWLMGGLVLVSSSLLLWMISGDIRNCSSGRVPGEIVAIWVMVYACMMTLCWVAQTGLWITCGSMIFCVLIFRLTLIDQLTGLLPREWTVGCLFAGLLFAVGNGHFPEHLAAALVIWCFFYTWRAAGYWQKGKEVLGLGDVWLSSALAAWLGFEPALYAIALGCGGFYLWLSVARLGGGPMGPWLGGCSLIAMIFQLHKPALMW